MSGIAPLCKGVIHVLRSRKTATPEVTYHFDFSVDA